MRAFDLIILSLISTVMVIMFRSAFSLVFLFFQIHLVSSFCLEKYLFLAFSVFFSFLFFCFFGHILLFFMLTCELLK